MIKCPICGEENSEGRKFCEACGGALPEVELPEVPQPYRPFKRLLSKLSSKKIPIAIGIIIAIIVVIAIVVAMEAPFSFYSDTSEQDSDGDGILDVNDFVPYKDAKIMINLIKFKVKDDVNWLSKANVYFKIYIDDYFIRAPESGTWTVKTGESGDLFPPDWDYIYNIRDDVKLHTIKIKMYDSRIVTDDHLLDINGWDDYEDDLFLDYNIEIGGWKRWNELDYHYGSGVADGSEDVTHGNDCYLEFDITTV